MRTHWLKPTLFLLGVIISATPAWGSDPDDVSATDLPRQIDWLQWRGPNRDSLVEADWPEKVADDAMKQSWRIELGPSYSGPIVAGDRVFVTETVDKKDEVVRALDRKTGKELWNVRWTGSLSVPFFAKKNGDWIRSTPACDGERLYVGGIRDVMVCLDVETGKEIWRVDFVEAMKSDVPSFGFASSPMILGDFLYVQGGGGFVKLNKMTGEVIWRVLADGGGMYGSAFSSPYFATIQGQPQLLVQTRDKLCGVNPDDGKIYWEQKIPAFRGMNILTPTVYKNSVFTSSYGGRSFLYNSIKSDSNWSVEEAWNNKTQAYMSSPVIIGDHAYVHLRNRRFTCIDLTTGKEQWTTQPFGEYWSMVSNGDKILALDQRGELLLIKASPEEFKLLDRRTVGDDSWAHLAVCGDEVFIRELNAMAAYQWK